MARKAPDTPPFEKPVNLILPRDPGERNPYTDPVSSRHGGEFCGIWPSSFPSSASGPRIVFALLDLNVTP